MKQNLKFRSKYLAFGFLLLAFSFFTGCKKTDHFYTTLQDLPQIDYNPDFAYKPAYIIGDTMVISGRLQPKNNLKINIGGIPALVVKVGIAGYNTATSFEPMDQVSILITAAMVGKAREVSVSSGGNTITGTPVDVYSAGGPGSFTDSLKAVAVKTLTGGINTFLYCVNGKGDMYYYASATKDLRHITKDGTEEILFDFTKSLDTGSNIILNAFLTGGVDSLQQTLYCSVRTNTGYRFLQLDLATKKLVTLNQSTSWTAPFEGNIGTTGMIVTGVYPGTSGKVYLGIGLGNNSLITNDGQVFLPDAIALYDSRAGTVSYIYKRIVQGDVLPAGLPGIQIFFAGGGIANALRFSPQENLLYAFENTTGNFGAEIEVFSLSARIKIRDFSNIPQSTTVSQSIVIAPFSGVGINLGTSNGAQSDLAFGFMPMPGKRLQTLVYQYNPFIKKGYPQWIVFDFNDARTYAYAPGKFIQSSYIFQPTDGLSQRLSTRDELLNYDEDGNLYMTANGKTVVIKTQKQ